MEDFILTDKIDEGVCKNLINVFECNSKFHFEGQVSGTGGQYDHVDISQKKSTDLELSNFATKELLDDKIIYVVKSKNEKKIIPNFLIDKKIVVNDLNILLNGLKLVSDFLEKTILKPNNLNYPISRTQFINSLR